MNELMLGNNQLKEIKISELFDIDGGGFFGNCFRYIGYLSDAGAIVCLLGGVSAPVSALFMGDALAANILEDWCNDNGL